ncbi:CocE/NonD family hydrolase [Streptomyces sp. NPDC020792]|uniref:CocE/NonD family hydrolase n=1 Tax=Streptomyces sp. NPDC020792 TaxID=3365089 RepID=UPI0037A69CB8
MAARTHGPAPAHTWAPPSGKPALVSRLMRATWRGLPRKRHDAGWEPGLVVPAADGSPLITDHYFPRAQGDFPTLLVRSPYGRGLPWSPMYGMLFAEQGFHVVLQSCRGTGGSGGAFHLWRNEAEDGRLGTVGPSYLGYVQWALALEPPPELKAMVVQVGLHDPHALFHAGGALRLENVLAVGAGMTYQHQGMAPFLRATLRLQRRLRDVTFAQPLRGAYVSALGGEVPWLDDVMTHPDADDAYWRDASPAAAADRLNVPTSLITGWHDALVDQTLEQYERLRRSGCRTALLVGPWTHTSALQQGWPEMFAESLAWLRAHLCGDPCGLRPTAVRVHIGGEDAWRDLDDWPADPATTTWFPTPDGHLTRQAPTDSGPLASFRYDPADPTPSLGGAGAHPRYARNPGTGESPVDAATFTAVRVTLHADSALTLAHGSGPA